MNGVFFSFFAQLGSLAWIGIVGVFLCIVIFIAGIFKFKKVPCNLGKRNSSFTQKRKLSFIVICALSFVLPISCLFRNWSLFIAIMFSVFGCAILAFGLREFFRLCQAGLYENGFIVGGLIFRRNDIDFMDFLQQGTGGFINIQTLDRKKISIYIEETEDFNSLQSIANQWKIQNSENS